MQVYKTIPTVSKESLNTEGFATLQDQEFISAVATGTTIKLGGVGSIITSKEILANYIHGLVTANVTNFIVVANDVFFDYSGASNLEIDASSSISIPYAINEIIDLSGKIIQCIAPVKSIRIIKLSGLTTTQSNSFWNNGGLNEVYLPNVITIGSSSFQSCGGFTFSAPLVTTVNIYAFRNATIIDLILPLCTSFNVYALYQATITNLDLRGMTSFGAVNINQGHFTNATTITNLIVSNFFATNNAGGIDATVQAAITVGTNVTFV